MNLSRKISPVWSAVVCGGFIGAIGFACMAYQPEAHEPAVISPHKDNSHQTNITPSILNAAEPWKVTFNPDIDEKCGTVKDDHIRYIKEKTYRMLEEPGEDGLSFGEWVLAYQSIQYLRLHFGKAVEQCIHPVLFNAENVEAHKRDFFESLKADSKNMNDNNVSLEERALSWRHIYQLLEMVSQNKAAPFIQNEDMRKYLGYDLEKFLEIGQELGRPYIDSVLAEVSEDIRKPFDSFTTNQVEKLYDKISWAYDISRATEMNEERLDNLKMALQNWGKSPSVVWQEITP